MATRKMSKNGQSFFDVEDTPDSVEAAEAKGYQSYMDMTKDGKDVYSVLATADSVEAATKKGYQSVEAFANHAAMPKAQLPVPSKALSAAQGAASAMAVGLDDEIIVATQAATGALGGDFNVTQNYVDGRDQIRDSKKMLEAANPWSYNLASAAAGIATGAGLAKGAGVAANALNTMKGSAAMGAVEGVGQSEAEGVAGLAKSAALGGVLSGGLHGAVGLAGAAGLKGVELFSDVSAKNIKTYWNNRAAVNAAPELEDQARRTSAQVKEYFTNMREDSTAGYKTLKDSGVTQPLEEVLAPITAVQQKAYDTGAFTPAAKAAMNELEEVKKEAAALAATNGGEFLRLDQIKNLQKQVYNVGEKSGLEGLVHQASGEINQGLKAAAPAQYAEEMEDLASRASRADTLNRY
ncbi:MAG TPA: hypothetical protein VNM48_12050, partial [Chloroflexota bacterium]|nr:hypothetical protein [Chloroflexota bacterium]